MKKLKFCECLLDLDGKPMSFQNRPYLSAVYGVDRGNLVVRASRQVEKSTFLANTIIHECWRNPTAKILFVAPRYEQGRIFSRDRLIPLLKDSPVIRRLLLGRGHRLNVNDLELSNGARIYIRNAFHSADACRGISASMLIIDEVQDVAAGDLPVLEETLSHAKQPRTILTGTPKLIDNHLEEKFNRSTANLWTMHCAHCNVGVTIDERSLGATGLICPRCQNAVDPAQGRWVARNPHSTWGQGFSISHPMVSWLEFHEILDRQRSYDPVRFRNEVLGLPTSLGDHVVTRAELEQCCGSQRMLQFGDYADLGLKIPIFAGIDWGGGRHSRTVIVLGSMSRDRVFEVRQFFALHATEDPHRVMDQVSKICNYYKVCAIAADGNGNGHMYSRMLLAKVQPRYGFFAIYYSGNNRAPEPDGAVWKWTVNRSSSIGVLFGRVKQQRLVLPCRQDADPFLDEFACEIAEYDDLQRSIKYIHPPTQMDDALHATNYALLIATRKYHAEQQWSSQMLAV